MREKLVLRCFVIAIILFIAGIAIPANAMPNFARKYGVPCTTCHTTIPRLNETGYKFRAAGFRLLEEIGKADDKKFELGDYFAARLQARYDTQVTNQPNGAAVANVINNVAGPRTTTNALSFQEFTLYPLTGSWGKYFGSHAMHMCVSSSASQTSFSPPGSESFTRGRASEPQTARSATRVHSFKLCQSRLEAEPFHTCSSPGVWMRRA